MEAKPQVIYATQGGEYMKKLSVILVIGFLFVFGCANRQLSQEGYKIASISDPSKCEFVKNVYFEARAATIGYYAQLNTEKAGGDSYKILNVSSERAAGFNIQMVNIEVYKCKK